MTDLALLALFTLLDPEAANFCTRQVASERLQLRISAEPHLAKVLHDASCHGTLEQRLKVEQILEASVQVKFHNGRMFSVGDKVQVPDDENWIVMRIVAFEGLIVLVDNGYNQQYRYPMSKLK